MGRSAVPNAVVAFGVGDAPHAASVPIATTRTVTRSIPSAVRMGATYHPGNADPRADAGRQRPGGRRQALHPRWRLERAALPGVSGAAAGRDRRRHRRRLERDEPPPSSRGPLRGRRRAEDGPDDRRGLRGRPTPRRDRGRRSPDRVRGQRATRDPWSRLVLRGGLHRRRGARPIEVPGGPGHPLELGRRSPPDDRAMVTTAPNGDAPPVPLHAAFDLAALRRQRFIARDDLRGIRTALTAILIAAILVLAVGSSGALAATTMTPKCDATNLRTGPGTSYAKKTSVNEGAKLTVVATVSGGSWSATCGTSLSGSSWHRISAINGRSVASLYGVTYLYGASKLFKALATATAPPPTSGPTPVVSPAPTAAPTAAVNDTATT